MLKLSGVIFLMMGSSCARYVAHEERPSNWAKPVAVEGVPNLYRVSRDLYRSAQPTREGMVNLEKMGIRTVINLRPFSNDAKEVAGTSLRRIDIPMHAWAPQDDHDDRVFSILNHSSGGPFLIHCYHGADRTGSLVALYRVRNQGWSIEQALEEMKYGGYGCHKIWKNLIVWTQEEAEESDEEKMVGELALSE